MMRRITVWAVLLATAGAAWGGTTIHVTNKWAWASGTGWLNCRTDTTNGVAVGEYWLSGYMYGSSVGWINMGGTNGPTNGYQYSNGSSADFGVNHDGRGHLTGYAWNESAGWINFGWTNNPDASTAPKLNLQSGIFTGYAWSSGLGWVSLSNISTRLQTVSLAAGMDRNSNGIPDAWEIRMVGNTNTLTSTNRDDYIADTNPTNSQDQLEATAFGGSGTNLSLTWASKKSRLYYIDMKTNLMVGAWQSNVLGPIVSATESNTVGVLSATGTQGFFRIRVGLPLSP